MVKLKLSYLITRSRTSVFNYQISGKRLSYNNLIDLDSGIKCLRNLLNPHQ